MSRWHVIWQAFWALLLATQVAEAQVSFRDYTPWQHEAPWPDDDLKRQVEVCLGRGGPPESCAGVTLAQCQTQQLAEQCHYREAHLWNRLGHDAYLRVLVKYSDRRSLITNQEAWRLYATSECEFNSGLPEGVAPFNHGVRITYQIEKARCHLRLSALRAIMLFRAAQNFQ